MRGRGEQAAGARPVSPRNAAAPRTTTGKPSPPEPPGSEPRRTRGGWIPVGTAAERRAVYEERGTARGQRSRQVLIEAARRVFERDGYLNVGVDDIVAEAGVARGSFYTYFPSKVAVFREVAAEVGRRIAESVARQPDDVHRPPLAALDHANRRYIETYREMAAIYGLVEQLATVDDEIKASRQETHRRHVARVAAKIRAWQRRGVADPDVDPTTTAAALVSMTSHLCYWQFVGGDDHDEEQLAQTLQRMWIRALDLRDETNPAWIRRTSSRRTSPARPRNSRRTR